MHFLLAEAQPTCLPCFYHTRCAHQRFMLRTSLMKQIHLQAECIELQQRLDIREEEYRSLLEKSHSQMRLVDAVESEVGAVKEALSLVHGAIKEHDAQSEYSSSLSVNASSMQQLLLIY